MPAARTNDPATSHAAASAVFRPSEVQRRILDIVRRLPGIDEHIIADYSLLADARGWTMPSESSIRSRRSDLVRHGLIRPKLDDDGKPVYGTTKGGNPSQIWEAVV